MCPDRPPTAGADDVPAEVRVCVFLSFADSARSSSCLPTRAHSSSLPSPHATPQQVSVLVVGAGPTGLGAAARLAQHGLDDWLLIDEVSVRA